MKLLKQLFIGLMLMTTGALSAQSTLKFGHVNTQSILSVMPELKNVEEQLKGEYEKLEAQLTDMQEALKTLQQDYIKKMQENAFASPDEQANMETEINEMNAKVQNFYQESQRSLQEKEQQLKLPLFEKVSNAIKEVGAENNFLYIFEEVGGVTVYKSEKSVDVSPLVKAKLGIQ
ncbi:OmpH family outer membrane protein [Plebeiibacterium marinum]|uniref:OmpH family outer membrane protein n=1 Tax=Plebeiibacterium marinum TaxID=2992111 RepID=A0AAE3SKK2_9BACT|nr:OmpH family outer membrane protein [Plebeiobacterium marinum]MCW3806514.1 OmpH family outer membrane protein [Plebeiobacterium marinum]